MARRAKTRSSRQTRDAFAVTREKSNPRSFATAFTVPSDPLGDRRRYHPERPLTRPLFSFNRLARSLMLRDVGAHKRQTKAKISFVDPRRVLVCARRHTRREVLFSLGKGSGGRRRPIRPKRRAKHNQTSKLSCR